MITRNQAIAILEKNIKNKNLFRHCLAVEAAMKGLANHFHEDMDKWGLVGLLHDGDWEATRTDHLNHTKEMHDWLKEAGETDEEVLRAILSHNYLNNHELAPKTKMEWALYTCDELTGLIVASALVMPDKKLSSVTVESVIKKFPSKSFAAAVNRDQIRLCQEKLALKLHDFVAIVLKSMQTISPEIGL
jgi:predicted hydrolase (HD superfamily)